MERNDRTITRTIARDIMAMLLAIVAAVCVSAFAMAPSASATDATDKDYYQELMSDEGWGADVITDNDEINGNVKDPEGVVDIFLNIIKTAGLWVVALSFVLAGTRMAWRGVLEITLRQNRSMKTIPSFLLTGEERATGTATTEWVYQMMKESLLYIGLGLFVFSLLGAIMSFVIFGLNTAGAAIQ